MLRRGEIGQASVELVAVLPLVVVLGLLAWQSVVAGQAVWVSGGAARAAARAAAVGGDAVDAARAAVPPRLRHGLAVSRPGSDGTVEVTLPIPAVVSRAHLGTVSARARFVPQGGGGAR